MLRLLKSSLLACALFSASPFYAQSIQILKHHVSSGDIRAAINLADRYDTGTGVPTNYAMAAPLYFGAAQNGDHHSQYKIGTYLRRGLGVNPDLEQSLAWLQKAAKSNDGEHLFALAQMYESGVGTPMDITTAIQLYQRAADVGHTLAHANLGVIYQTDDRDLERAVKHYETAAALGNARAQNNLGMMYSRGQGVTQDYNRAFTLFQDAAKTDLPSAIKNLGVMYENGFGVTFDETKAHALYKRAGQNTQHLIAETISNLRQITDPRINLPQTPDIANLYQLAESGDIISQYTLAMLMHNGQIKSAPSSEIAKRMQVAAQAGFADARAKLGMMYLSGTGVAQDYVQAYAWISMASASGVTQMKELQNRLSSLMTRHQTAQAQQFAAKQWDSSLNR
jgi:TPR repeat protein